MRLGLLDALTSDGGGNSGPVVHLFEHPYVSQSTRAWDIAEGSTRLVAFLALQRAHLERRFIAGSLWPGVTEPRAAGNLRSALWRLNNLGFPLIRSAKSSLGLLDDVRVDAHLLGDWANRVIAGAHEPRDMAVMPWDLDRLDLLPGWYDDWVLVERERLRHRLLHALEAMSRALVAQARYSEAVEAAMAVVRAEPLRESGQRVLIEAHLAEGNWREAKVGLDAYRRLLGSELGVRPSPSLIRLLDR
jgi:DNA-binding SARP family transcriptional activator